MHDMVDRAPMSARDSGGSSGQALADMPPIAPLDMPLRALTEWPKASPPRAATAPSDIVRRRAIMLAATLVMAGLSWNATYQTVALGGVTRLEVICLALLAAAPQARAGVTTVDLWRHNADLDRQGGAARATKNVAARGGSCGGARAGGAGRAVSSRTRKREEKNGRGRDSEVH